MDYYWEFVHKMQLVTLELEYISHFYNQMYIDTGCLKFEGDHWDLDIRRRLSYEKVYDNY